jgi:CrcB protein
MQRVFWICAAGAAGTGARYLLGLWAGRRFGSGFPFGTLAVNLIGCFLLTVLVELAVARNWADTTRLAITVGLLGGFTTYSSFNHETMRLAGSGALGAASLNVLLTLVGGLAAGLLGLLFVRALILR